VAKKATQKLVEHWRDAGPVEWAEGAYGWIGPDGKTITLEPWQRAIVQAWWERRDVVTTLAISSVKKTGKTFVDAVLLAWRWLALPGQHFTVANDMDQSAGRQFQQIAEMVRRNEYLRSNCRLTRSEIEFLPTGSTITALAVDAAGNAGANHLTASHTEMWGIIYEAGIRAFEELTPPPGRLYGLPALRICDSYAGFEGESDTWHKLVDRGLTGERVSDDWPIYLAGGMLLFHMDGLEAQERCFRGTPEEAAVYYEDQRATLRPGTFERLHLNRRASGEEAFIALEDWDACVDPDHRPQLPSRGLVIYAAADASIKHDNAAVVAVGYNRDVGKVMLVRHRIWQPTALSPLDIDGTIGEFLRELSDGYNLEGVYYDPYQLHDLSTRLRAEGLPMIEYPQSVPNLTSMGQNLFELIKAGNLLLYPSDELRVQAGHTIALQTSRGWRIAKEKTSYKIDAIVALAMAALAAVRVGGLMGAFSYADIMAAITSEVKPIFEFGSEPEPGSLLDDQITPILGG
jgi:phage terminase large subunit-like protein